MLDKSACYTDATGGLVVFESKQNIFSISFKKGEKNETHPILVSVSNFEVEVKSIVATDPKAAKPELPPKLTFDVKDIHLPNGFTDYTCDKQFNYTLTNQLWKENATDKEDTKHDVSLVVKDIFFQLNSTAVAAADVKRNLFDGVGCEVTLFVSLCCRLQLRGQTTP